MKLNAKALGLALGVICGAGIFIATIWLLVVGTEGKTIGLLSHIYIGYNFSVVGAFVGLIWGFIDGLIGGYLLAVIYNAFLPKESK